MDLVARAVKEAVVHDAGDRRDHLQTLERGLSVVLAFSGAGPWLTLTDLSATTGLTKPTVRRILLTLERLGYARSDGHRYALTPKVLGLGYAYLSSVRLTDVAHPRMEMLTDRLGVDTSLAALDGADVVYVDRVQRHRVTSINLAAGTRLPAHATSMGHVLLADLGPEALEVYLTRTTLPALTDRTITDPSRLRDRLALVRDRGWDIVDQELEIGRRSAAAPVRDAAGQVVAALALSYGTAECGVDELVTRFVPILCRTACEISALLGDAGRPR